MRHVRPCNFLINILILDQYIICKNMFMIDFEPTSSKLPLNDTSTTPCQVYGV